MMCIVQVVCLLFIVVKVFQAKSLVAAYLSKSTLLVLKVFKKWQYTFNAC